jgi:3-isopropylmalate dehydrogenase
MTGCSKEQREYKMKIKITLLPGDGIGPEVTAAAVQVMQHMANKYDISFETCEHLIGGASYDKHKTPLTDETLNACLNSQIVFLGAVGGYQWENLDHHLKPEAALLKLRKELKLFANLRPAKVYPAFVSSSSLKEEIISGTDFLVLRELTGGIYFGEPRGYDRDHGYNTMTYSHEEVARIARKAFETARIRQKRVTSVDKANVLECSQFWRHVVQEVHQEYSDIALNHMYVDNAAMQIVRDPKQFDVVLTGNMFGDILSDIAGMITGSLGMLPSASLGETYALYEPVHGSAPDIAGQNKANPIAAISSMAMMFAHSLKQKEAAGIIEKAIENTLKRGFRTVDIYREGDTLLSTTEMRDKIIEEIDALG